MKKRLGDLSGGVMRLEKECVAFKSPRDAEVVLYVTKELHSLAKYQRRRVGLVEEIIANAKASKEDWRCSVSAVVIAM
ncbi:hypothetical protein BASA60_007222 [Batrachochytrium salamandrivorans]|nr:hypothetical protein BASA60_007222 [Batrachochytrium salamandrivorans]